MQRYQTVQKCKKNLKTEKMSKNAKNLMTAKQAQMQRTWKSRI